jgi:hypothetical protein
MHIRPEPVYGAADIHFATGNRPVLRLDLFLFGCRNLERHWGHCLVIGQDGMLARTGI